MKTSTTAPTYKLSAQTITFGRADKEQKQMISVVPGAANIPVDLSAMTMLSSGGVTVEPNAGALTITVPGGTVNGNYWFDIPSPDNKALPLTVKVDKKPLTATVKAEKGNIDLMDRAHTKLSYIPTIKNTQAGITGVEFANPEAVSGKLNVAWDETAGKAIVTATRKNIKKGEKFSTILRFTLADGNMVDTKPLTIKPAQSRVKHVIPKLTTMFQSRTTNGYRHYAVIDLASVTPAGARIANFSFKDETLKNRNAKKQVNNPNGAYWYSFDPTSQKLHIWIQDAALVKPGKATLTFSAVYDGQGWERHKPINSTVFIDNASKPVDIKIPVTVVR